MTKSSSLLSAALLGTLLSVSPVFAQVTNQGLTQAAGGHVSVIQGGAYSPRHDVYLTVYESPTGIRGRFVNTAGATVGNVFAIAAAGTATVEYANKPMVAYSHDTDDDVFFVMYASDFGKGRGATPAAWIQRVSYTGSGGALVGTPIQAGDLGWEIPNDIVYNPASRQFVAVWERFFSEGPDVMTRFFTTAGAPATGIVNVTTANHGQGAAKAAVDWERNRILIAYQGLHPNSPANPEILGLWAKIVDGTNGALLTGLLTAQNGFTIEPVPIFLPERDGFAVAWTGFNPGRDVQARFISSATASLGTMPAGVFTIAGSGRQEGASMGMYDAISRRVLVAVQSSGGCPADTCPYLDGAVLDGQGTPLSSFTGLSTAVPSLTGGSFYPDVSVGENGQFGVSYTLNYFGVYVERVSMPAASVPGPSFAGGTPAATGVSVSPSSVSFSIVKAGATIGSVTPQTLTVTFSTGTSGSWTATSSSPWLQVTGGSGSGNGSFTVTITNPSNVIGSQTSQSGTIVLTAASAPNSPLSVPVSLSVTPFTLAAMSPLGQVDTPAQNATGVQGGLGVTGWVLDDGTVTSVQVFRNCLPGRDNPASCQTVLGHNVVFVGNAAFLPGARPDVEAAFPLYPNADRAGFGLLVLTNQLPHIPNNQLTGGQGALTIYVMATDNVGNKKLLGRSSDPAASTFNTPTTVTLANDSIAKPFGALDTPALGATVSGQIPVFGWALTPDSNTVSGDVDVIIPLDGSTMVVYIDGAARANVAYNQCRGTVGNPVPTGVFCNDDVANQFGNTTAQAPFTVRGSNPTLFRNLDAGRAAIGAYVLDTSSLTNGLHTIAWSVMDSAGRTEGIGSRFFTVSNGSSLQADAMLSRAPAVARALASTIEGIPAGSTDVWGRVGFDLSQAWQEMPLDAKGERTVRLDEMGRLELWLGGGVDTAYLVANGTLRDLPVGSALDGPHFTWVPGPGMIGPFTLAFLRGGERIDVVVTIVPPVGAREGVAEVRMHLDTPVAGSTSGKSVAVQGWALDPDAALGSGIATVHVWARNTRTQAAVFMGEAQVGVARPDVAQAFGARFTHTGFYLSGSLAAGDWEVTAYVWNRRTQRWEDARSAVITVR